jgi:hypothetical protein
MYSILNKLKMTQLEKLSKTNKNKISEEMLLNVWLEKYFETTIEEIIESGKYKNDISDSRKFYADHAVTEEQHDWWQEEVRKIFKKKFGAKLGEKTFSWAYINTAPSIKK